LNAIILAAGEGKRLRPLTENIPKCMIELFGKSLLQSQIDTFHKCNILDITVVTGYQSESIKFPDITYFKNENYYQTNMGETLFCAKEKLIDSVIISYGDIIFESNILQKLIDSKDDYSVIIDKNWEKYWRIRFDRPLNDAETLVLDNQNYIMESNMMRFLTIHCRSTVKRLLHDSVRYLGSNQGSWKRIDRI